MATMLDHVIGLKKETTYGTPVVVNRFYPWADGTKADWNPRRRQGKGIVAGGRRTQLGSRTFLPTGQGTVTVKAELESKGAGVLLDLGLGVSTVTAVTGGAQINFNTTVTGTLLGSATIQLQKIRNDGTAVVETYAGCTASKVIIEQPKDEIATVEVEFDALSYTTSTGAASATYATSPVLYDASQVTCGLGGTLTVPTTTTLATGLTASTAFQSWKVEIDQKIAADRWVLAASRNQPVAGMPDIKFTAATEFNNTTLTAALTAGTILPWYSTWTTTEVVSGAVTGFSGGQVVLPQLTITKGLPSPKPGELGMVDIEAEVKNDGTHNDLYFCYLTSDTAL